MSGASRVFKHVLDLPEGGGKVPLRSVPCRDAGGELALSGFDGRAYTEIVGDFLKAWVPRL
ncbi:MAG: hypothetical protein EOR99_32945 [Mesorhizobium sp.]|nr:MAG: hypothetical protein EOR99_32945 [Mesorhizobium sp.]